VFLLFDAASLPSPVHSCLWHAPALTSPLLTFLVSFPIHFALTHLGESLAWFVLWFVAFFLGLLTFYLLGCWRFSSPFTLVLLFGGHTGCLGLRVVGFGSGSGWLWFALGSILALLRSWALLSAPVSHWGGFRFIPFVGIFPLLFFCWAGSWGGR